MPRSHGIWLEALPSFSSLKVFKAAALASASASSNGEVTRRFAFTPASKAGLCPWPQVTGTDCVAAFQGNDFQSLGKSADFPLSRAFARVRKKGILKCRSLGTRRALALLRVPSHHLAYDHQMTPPWFRPLFRAYALSRPSLAERLSGTPSAALRPKASHGLRTKRGSGSSVGRCAACRVHPLGIARPVLSTAKPDISKQAPICLECL